GASVGSADGSGNINPAVRVIDLEVICRARCVERAEVELAARSEGRVQRAVLAVAADDEVDLGGSVGGLANAQRVEAIVEAGGEVLSKIVGATQVGDGEAGDAGGRAEGR